MTTTPVEPLSRTADVYAALCPARDVLDVLSASGRPWPSEPSKKARVGSPAFRTACRASARKF